MKCLDGHEKNPSVLFIIVDSLQPEVLGTNGNTPSPTPYLDQLFQNGVTLKNCFQSGQPTQFAMPGLMASTLPLDYGGYTYGIKNRPVVLPELMSRNGYNTGAFTAGGAIGRLGGFDRGVDIFRPLHPVYSLRKIPYIGPLRSKVRDGDCTKTEAVRVIREYVGEFLKSVKTYSEERNLEAMGERTHPVYHSPLIHDWDSETAITQLARAIERYEEDPDEFVESLLDSYPDLWYLEEFADPEEDLSEVSRLRRARVGFDIARTQIDLLPYPSFSDPTDRRQLREAARIGYGSYDGNWTSARYILENLYEWINGSSEPVFAWAHVHDLHKTNIFSWEFDRPEWHAAESAVLRSYLRSVRASGSPFLGSLPYALSARYVDHVIEQFVGKLQKTLSEPPLVVITADHGTTVRRHRQGHRVLQFYDELLHIPVTFSHPSLERTEFNGLCSALDVAPTMLDILGITAPAEFDGRSIRQLPPDGSEYIIAEDLGRGTCEYGLESANLCIRSADYKLIGSVTDGKFVPESGYDLGSDPEETDPIAPDELPAAFDTLKTAANKRATGIHNSLVEASQLMGPQKQNPEQ
jgi:hypothetical protein